MKEVPEGENTKKEKEKKERERIFEGLIAVKCSHFHQQRGRPVSCYCHTSYFSVPFN